MLQNWTVGLQTFGKWLEYFQMAEMHWQFFCGTKKLKNWGNEWDLESLLSPSEFYVHHIAVGGNVLQVYLCVSVRHIFFLSKRGPGRQKGDSIYNQQFHSAANPRQPEGYQHCEALAPESGTAVAAMWEFLTAGCVGLSIFFRLGQSWCEVCFILGRWHRELSVLKTYASVSLDCCDNSFVPLFTRVSRLIPTLPLDTAMLIYPPNFTWTIFAARSRFIVVLSLDLINACKVYRLSVRRAEHPWV